MCLRSRQECERALLPALARKPAIPKLLSALWTPCPIKTVACPLHGCSALWIPCPLKVVACPLHGCSTLWIPCPL